MANHSWRSHIQEHDISYYTQCNQQDKVFEKLKKYGITTIVRVCEATYDTALMGKEGIRVLLEWPFDEGCHPTRLMITC